MARNTHCSAVHMSGFQNVFSKAECIADHEWPWAVFCHIPQPYSQISTTQNNYFNSIQILRDSTAETMKELRVAAIGMSEFVDDQSGIKVRVVWMTGGDMKFSLIFHGLSNATSACPCMFCKKRKDQFHEGKLNVTDPKDYFKICSSSRSI